MVMTARRPGGWCSARVPIPTTSQKAGQRRSRLLADPVETSTGSSIVEHSPAVIRLSILVSRRRLRRRVVLISCSRKRSRGACGLRPVPARRAAATGGRRARPTLLTPEPVATGALLAARYLRWMELLLPQIERLGRK